MEKVLLATCWKLRKVLNTSVFARHWPKNTVNTVVFVTRGKQHRKYRGFGLPRRKTHQYLRCFLPRELQTNVKTPPIWRFSATTGLRRKLHGQQRQQRQQQQQQHQHRILSSEFCPPDLNHKESPKIYQIERQKELQNIYQIKCECQIACQKICHKSVTWWGSLEESNFFRRLSNINLRQPKWRLVGPCAHHRHHQQR